MRKICQSLLAMELVVIINSKGKTLLMMFSRLQQISCRPPNLKMINTMNCPVTPVQMGWGFFLFFRKVKPFL